MAAYYNEIEPYAAEWLRNLIKVGLIAPGDVDERSIEDVCPDDLRGYTQCHFFAGIGGWSYALRLAGIPDNRPIWTGSCPCQPFSAAGKGRGFADERHLWPAWHWLIRQCRPERIVGEQVASNLAWLDLVQGDLEGESYTVGATIVGAHSVSAPHIRQRLYWVAHYHHQGRSLERGGWVLDRERQTLGHDSDGCGADVWVDDAACSRARTERRNSGEVSSVPPRARLTPLHAVIVEPPLARACHGHFFARPSRLRQPSIEGVIRCVYTQSQRTNRPRPIRVILRLRVSSEWHCAIIASGRQDCDHPCAAPPDAGGAQNDQREGGGTDGADDFGRPSSPG